MFLHFDPPSSYTPAATLTNISQSLEKHFTFKKNWGILYYGYYLESYGYNIRQCLK